MGFPRQEYWSGLPSSPPGDLPWRRIRPASPAPAGRVFTSAPPGSLGLSYMAFIVLRCVSSWCRTPSLGSPTWGSELTSARDPLESSPSVWVGRPVGVMRLCVVRLVLLPILSWLLLHVFSCGSVWQFLVLFISGSSADGCDSGGPVRGGERGVPMLRCLGSFHLDVL